jgi:hypothetical protein
MVAHEVGHCVRKIFHSSEMPFQPHSSMGRIV